MNIAYYISSFGLGHTSRAIPIIRMLSKKHHLHIKCSNLSLKSIKANLPENSNMSLYEQITDVWMNYEGLEIDIKRSTETSYAFYSNMEENIIEKESNFIKKNNIQMIISDITPLLDRIGRKFNIPVIGISNFDWGKLYEHISKRYDSKELFEIAELLKSSYEMFDMQIALPLNKGLLTKKDVEKTGFFSRERFRTRQEIIQILNICKNNRIIFLSFGMSLEFPAELMKEMLKDLNNYEYIASNTGEIDVTSPFKYIPKEDYRTQDYIGASNIFLGKPGWGTLSECYCNNVPVILAEFEENLEWTVMIKEMKKIYQNTRSFPITDINAKTILEYIKEFSTIEYETLQDRFERSKMISLESLNEINNLINSF